LARANQDDERSNFQQRLITELANLQLYAFDMNLFTKKPGDQFPTGYHSDLLYSLPFANRVIQLWIPLACEGSPEDVANSMLRIDSSPLKKGWGVSAGSPAYVNVWTGEQRTIADRIPEGMRLSEDLEGAFGGATLKVGDALLFHNSHCHYTLASDAFRVGLAIRLFDSLPISSGYFDEPRPEFPTNPIASQNLALLKKEVDGYSAGQKIPLARFYNSRLGYDAELKPRAPLQAHYQDYARHIAGQCRRVLDESP